MAILINENSIGEAWGNLIDELVSGGNLVAPRGQETTELTNVTIHVKNGLNNIFNSTIRDLNYRFMIAEWLWIGAGMGDVASIAKYNERMKNFSDDGKTLAGAYGPRLGPQNNYLYNTLNKPDTRQAVASIWTPNPRASYDIPCTISLQWLIRDNKLNVTATMRSSDAWLGLPYDFFNFSQLTNMMCDRHNVKMGSVTMNLASSHLYEIHFDKAKEFLNSTQLEHISSPVLLSKGKPSQQQIVQILNQETFMIDGIAPVWQKYASALTKNRKHALQILRELSSYKDGK